MTARTTRLGLAVAVAVLSALGTLVLLPAPPVSAATSPATYGARLVALVNDARTSHGLVPVSVAAGTSQVADGWAGQLARQQALSHNPDLRAQLETHGSSDWHDYGEIVGVGPADNPDAVFSGYMQSSVHRAVILDPAMRFVGVGVRDTGSSAWDTMDFVDSYHGSTAAAPAPAPRPKAVAPAPAPARVVVPVVRHVPAAAPAPRPRAATPAPPARDPLGWVTAVPLRHHNRAVPAALVAAHLPAAAAGSPGSDVGVPAVIAAGLVGTVSLGLLATLARGRPRRRAAGLPA